MKVRKGLEEETAFWSRRCGEGVHQLKGHSPGQGWGGEGSVHQGASDSLPVCWQGLERMWSSMVKERRARSWGLVLSKIVGRRPQTVRGHHALGEEEDVSSRSKWR